VTAEEIRAAAARELPEDGYLIAEIFDADDRGWCVVDVRYEDGEPRSRPEAPDDEPWLEVHAETGETRWYKGSTGVVPSPLP
jgi:hypothetical protein